VRAGIFCVLDGFGVRGTVPWNSGIPKLKCPNAGHSLCRATLGQQVGRGHAFGPLSLGLQAKFPRCGIDGPRDRMSYQGRFPGHDVCILRLGEVQYRAVPDRFLLGGMPLLRSRYSVILFSGSQ
jgi:hypothetical protein